MMDWEATYLGSSGDEFVRLEEESAPYDGRARPSDLVAWQRAIELSVLIYSLTQSWPRDEVYGLTSQIRRAGVSVAANIAEGQGRNGDREFLYQLLVAHGSLREVETLCVIAQRIGYLGSEGNDRLMHACNGTGKPLRGLIRHLKERVT